MSGLVRARPDDYHRRIGHDSTRVERTPRVSTRPMSSQAIAALVSIFAVIQVAWIVALAYGVLRILT